MPALNLMLFLSNSFMDLKEYFFSHEYRFFVINGLDVKLVLGRCDAMPAISPTNEF